MSFYGIMCPLCVTVCVQYLQYEGFIRHITAVCLLSQGGALVSQGILLPFSLLQSQYFEKAQVESVKFILVWLDFSRSPPGFNNCLLS